MGPGSCANFIIRDVTLGKTQDRSNYKLGFPVSIETVFSRLDLSPLSSLHNAKFDPAFASK